MSLERIDQRLDERFRVITGGAPTAPRRQQTLRALIDWSYDLLSEGEKKVLTRCSVFAGGWALDAAEHVCAGDGVEQWEVLDFLTSLVDKSLVAIAEDGDGTRYRMLESVRQYARDQAQEDGEFGMAARRHADFYMDLARSAAPKLSGSEQQAWLHKLDLEHDNLRLVLQSALAQSDSLRLLHMCGALQRFWTTRGYFSEGRDWCARALASGDGNAYPAERARVLNTAGVLAYSQSDHLAARALFEASLAIRRRLSDRREWRAALSNLGSLALELGDLDEAQERHEEALAIARELDDRSGTAASLNNLGNLLFERAEFAAADARYRESLVIVRELGDDIGIGNALNNLGTVATEQGRLDDARALLDEALAIRRAVGNPFGIARALNNLGIVAFEQREYAEARSLQQEALSIAMKLGDKRALASSLVELAALAGAEGDAIRSARVFGAAENLRESIGMPIPEVDRPRYERLVSTPRAALAHDQAFDEAWREGRSLSLEGVLALTSESAAR
jgi:predicted ATPase